MAEEIWVSDALSWGGRELARHGLERPYAEAVLLLAHALGVDKSRLYTCPYELLPAERFRHYGQLIERRAGGEPFAYIVGQKEFMSLDFMVDRRVLIPRPETEILVEAALEYLGRKPGSRLLAADIGTGCGAIAVSLAVHVKGLTVYATDISREALEVARANAVAHGVEGRIHFLAGDLYEAMEGLALEDRLDLVASNPPYVTPGEYEGLAPEVKQEPKGALVSNHGADIYRQLARGAVVWLKPGGAVLVEVGHKLCDTVMAAFREEGLTEVSSICDYAGIGRVVCGLKCSG